MSYINTYICIFYYYLTRLNVMYTVDVHHAGNVLLLSTAPVIFSEFCVEVCLKQANLCNQ